MNIKQGCMANIYTKKREKKNGNLENGAVVKNLVGWKLCEGQIGIPLPVVDSLGDTGT